eukprot:jgi/Mesvir1/14741/Mv05385-RA.3
MATEPAVNKVTAVLKYMELDDKNAVITKLQKSTKVANSASSMIARGNDVPTDRNDLFARTRQRVAPSTPPPELNEEGPRDIERLAQVAYLTGGVDLKLNPDEEEQVNRKVFAAYCTQGAQGGPRLLISRYHKLLRDAQMLDNAFTYSHADKLLPKPPLAASGATTLPGVGFDEFKVVMDEASTFKFPKQHPRVARRSLIRQFLLPLLGAPKKADADEDELYSAEVVAAFAQHEAALQTIFTHYATFDMLNAGKITWKAVEASNRSLNIHGLTYFTINFLFMPDLLSKPDVEALFASANVDGVADRYNEELSFPTFLEVLGRLSLLAVTRMQERLLTASSTVSQMYASERLLKNLSRDTQIYLNQLAKEHRLLVRDPIGSPAGFNKFVWDTQRMHMEQDAARRAYLTSAHEQDKATLQKRKVEKYRLKELSGQTRVWGTGRHGEPYDLGDAGGSPGATGSQQSSSPSRSEPGCREDQEGADSPSFLSPQARTSNGARGMGGNSPSGDRERWPSMHLSGPMFEGGSGKGSLHKGGSKKGGTMGHNEAPAQVSARPRVQDLRLIRMLLIG